MNTVIMPLTNIDHTKLIRIIVLLIKQVSLTVSESAPPHRPTAPNEN